MMVKNYDPTTDPRNASYKGPNFPDWPAVSHNSYGEPNYKPIDFVSIPENLRNAPRRNSLERKE
jgi:hypothetical protein